MVITELDSGGAERAFVKVATGLRRRGWQVRVISLRDAGRLAETLEAAGIPVVALHTGSLFDIRGIFRLKSQLRLHPCDVVLSFLHQANLMSRIAGRLAGIACIVSGIRVADRRCLVTVPERLTSWMVSRYVAVSEAVADVHARVCGISRNRIVVIANGVDIDEIQQVTPQPVSFEEFEFSAGTDLLKSSVKSHSAGSLKSEPAHASAAPASEECVILCAGRLSAQKAPLDLLAAFVMVRERSSEAARRLRLLYAGDGPLREKLLLEIRRRGLDSVVRLVGWRDDVIALMKSSSLLVLASHWEGLPNVVLEAMAAGLPVIVSSIDGNAELVKDGITGRLFPPGSVSALADQIQSHLNFPEESRQQASRAQAYVMERYRWDDSVQRYHEILAHGSDAV